MDLVIITGGCSLESLHILTDTRIVIAEPGGNHKLSACGLLAKSLRNELTSFRAVYVVHVSIGVRIGL